MTKASQSGQILRFGVYEADLMAGELRKHGVRLRLQQQPFRILVCLLERAGEIVTREELIQRLWPNGTIVEYEHSLGTAVNKIRQALRDTADHRRFVETIPRRGYRFLAPVEGIAPGVAESAVSPPSWLPADSPSDNGGAISRYRILEKIGSGGVGVVYKAEDTKLERPVALKFLAAHALEEPGHCARLLREAKAAARLDHPNICPIYEIDEADGQLFLAMAYLEGQTVEEKIAERPLPLEGALEIAIQTAEGLQAAHEKGIVHRDIKSANLMVTKRGGVKIMDFGLAQLAGGTRLTKGPAMMGTPAYMSPEQAQRQPTDRRTDIWSLGVVLYEMVTGRVPFASERDTAALHAIIHEEPEPVTALRTGLPVRLDAIVGKALAKNPQERYQDVDDLLVDLGGLRRELEAGQSTARPTSPAPSKAFAKGKRVALVTGIALVSLIAGSLLQRLGIFDPTAVPSRELPSRKFSFPVPNLHFGPGGNARVAISPDGKYIAYVAKSGIFVRGLSSGVARRLEGTEGAQGCGSPAWSPDSKFLAFATNGAVKRVAVQGGPPFTLCELPARHMGSVAWSSDGKFVIYGAGPEARGAGFAYEVYKIPFRGGDPTLLSQRDLSLNHKLFFRFFLPSGRDRLLLCSINAPWYRYRLALWNLDTGDEHSFGIGGLPLYAPTGHIVFQTSGLRSGIWAAPFSLNQLKVTGERFPIDRTGRYPSVSADGTLVYAESPAELDQLLLLDRNGIPLDTTVGQTQEYIAYPAFSPDGRRVAVWGREPDAPFEIWIHEVDRPIKSRLTFHDGMDLMPTWSPAGDQVAFSSARSGRRDLYVKPVDKDGPAEALFKDSSRGQWVTDWSLDGKYLLFDRDGSETEKDLWYLEQKEGREYEAKPLLVTPFKEEVGAFSPDSRYIAFTSDRESRNEVYVCPFPNCGDNVQKVSVDGGWQVRWSKKSGRLYYVEGDETMMEVNISTRPQLSVKTPRQLFKSRELSIPWSTKVLFYDVSADGERFVVVRRRRVRGAKDHPPMIHVWQNWAAPFRDR